MFELLAAAAALLPTILEVTVNLVIFAAIVTKALQALGIIGPDENAKELGDKAIQAEEEGITPENYDSYEEYMDAVRKFELDPEKSEQIEDEDKLKKERRFLQQLWSTDWERFLPRICWLLWRKIRCILKTECLCLWKN